MDVLYPRCCGVDVHKKQVVACLLTPGTAGTPRKAIRTFGTTTTELLRLVDWLQAAECTHVAMEATGVYWKPLYNVCEGLFTVIVANAQHIKVVPRWGPGLRWLHALRCGTARAGHSPQRTPPAAGPSPAPGGAPRPARHCAVVWGHACAQRSLLATVRSATSGLTCGRAHRMPAPLRRAWSTSVLALSTLPLPRG
jgi:transposase